MRETVSGFRFSMDDKSEESVMKKLWVAVFAGGLGYFACAVDFPAAVDGVITLTMAGTYSAAVPTSTKLVVNANGSVTLSSTTKYTGTVEIESGSTLVVPNTTILANAPINVKSGGTLNPTFASPGQWNKVFLQPITIAGAGNGGIGAFKYGGSGNGDSIVKTLVLSADATIDCSTRWGISNGNGAGMLDLAGHTLTRIGGNNLMLIAITVTPGTFLNTTGKITFQTNGGTYGVKAGCKAEETIFQIQAGTVEFWNTTAYVPYKIVLNGGVVSAGSGGNVPPRNCFSGPVDVNFWLNVAPDAANKRSLGFMGPLTIAKDKALCLNSAGTLYVGGPVSGEGHQLKVASDGLLVVQNDGDAGAPRFVMQNGSYELDVGTVKSEMMRVANGGSCWGVFRHKRGNMSFSTWDNPRVGESANSFGAYVFESGEMHPQNSFYLANENASSHGIFLQKGGHFVLEGNPNDNSLSRTFAAGACNAEIAFIQTGGTNDTLYARTANDSKARFSLGTKGGTNMTFVVTGKDTLFRTDGFWWGCETNKLKAVIAVNDGATFQARRFSCSNKRVADTDVTLSVDGGVIAPSFGWGWGNDGWDAATFLKRAPEHVIVGPKGIVFDTSKMPASDPSYMPLTLKAPEGQGIASVAIPTAAASAAYRGPVPVVIVGPAGSFGASAYADYDFATKKLSQIVVTSAGCNYDETTKIYLRSPDAKSTYLCTDFTLTGAQTSGALVKRGAAKLHLYGPNTYQGGTVVEEGELNVKKEAFPANTALTVKKGATLSTNTDTDLTVSHLAGEGAINKAAVTVTGSLDLDAAALLADGHTALTSQKKVTFAEGATATVSLTEDQINAFKAKPMVTLLTSADTIDGTPKLVVTGANSSLWSLRNDGKNLKFGYSRGSVIVVR